MDCLNELWGSPAEKMYAERVERIYEANRPEQMTAWELGFISDLYWNPREVYTEKQKDIINRILRKVKLD